MATLTYDGAPRRPELGRNLTFGLLEVLGRAILAGDYQDRPFPNEAELSQEHGVSRSVIREAVKMLGAKGLVGARPKQGTFLLSKEEWNLFDEDVLRWLLEGQSSIDLLRWFNELRIGVEPQAAALAAKYSTPEQREEIQAGLDQMKLAENGLADPLKADIAFHVAILRASNNPFYVRFRDMVATALTTSIRFTNRVVGRTANIAEHEYVLNAIKRSDYRGAHHAMELLIENVLAIIDNDNSSNA